MSAPLTPIRWQHLLSVLLLLAAAFLDCGQAADGGATTKATTAGATAATTKATTTTTTTNTMEPPEPIPDCVACAPDCTLPMEPGPCRMNLERYYYNAETNTCEKFKFGGCRGNKNKFGFRKTCEDACVKPTADTSVKTAAKIK